MIGRRMTIAQVLNYLILWSVVGALTFNLIVVYLFRSGRVYESRTEEGHLKQRMSLKGILSMLSFLGLIVASMTATNYLSLVRHGVELTSWSLFWLNLSLILILIVYDSLVIDWYVIGHWRPEFLALPEAMDREQMKEHIRRTFYVALPFSLLLAALSAGLTALLW